MAGAAHRLKPTAHVMAWIAVIIIAYGAALYLGVVIALLTGLDSLVGRLALHSALLVTMSVFVINAPKFMGMPRVSLKDAGLSSWMKWRHIGVGMLGFMLYVAIVSIVMPLVQKIAWFDVHQPQNLGLSGMSGLTLFAGFIVLVIVTPIMEEILFRGILQGKLREAGVSFIASALIVGVLFAAAHGQWNVAIDVFFMSLVASYIRERTGQLWPSIVVHVLKNFAAFYVTFVLVAGTAR